MNKHNKIQREITFRSFLSSHPQSSSYHNVLPIIIIYSFLSRDMYQLVATAPSARPPEKMRRAPPQPMRRGKMPAMPPREEEETAAEELSTVLRRTRAVEKEREAKAGVVVAETMRVAARAMMADISGEVCEEVWGVREDIWFLGCFKLLKGC